MAICKAVSSRAGLGTVIDYVEKENKTEDKLMSGINITPGTAKEEMAATKELWNKTTGREYKHFTINYHKDENITPEQAHKNAMEIVQGTKALQGFECLVVTHTDTDHINTHVIVNSVSYEDGRKLQWSKHDLADMKQRTNEQSHDQGLHVPVKGQHFDGSKNQDITSWSKDAYKVYEKNKEERSYKIKIATAVSQAKTSARSQTEFVKLMNDKGVGVDWKDNHKYITFTDLERQSKGEKKCKIRNNKLESELKIELGKEQLLYEFQRNNEREQYRNTDTERDTRNVSRPGEDKQPGTVEQRGTRSYSGAESRAVARFTVSQGQLNSSRELGQHFGQAITASESRSDTEKSTERAIDETDNQRNDNGARPVYQGLVSEVRDDAERERKAERERQLIAEQQQIAKQKHEAELTRKQQEFDRSESRDFGISR